MPLPAVKYPTFSLTIPSLKKAIKYRPFLVREYKLLLQALEMKDTANFINTIYDIIRSCTLGNVDVEKLSMYDIDYIFLLLRARSIGEQVPVEYRCVAPVQRKNEEGVEYTDKCGTKVKVKLDLNRIEVVFPEEYEKNRLVMIDSETGIRLRAPSFSQFKELSKLNNVESLYDIAEAFVYSCTESIFSGDSVYTPGVDFSREELTTFVESLPNEILEKINQFFTNLPYVALVTKIKCPSCGNEDTLVIKGLDDFFV